MDVSRMLSNGGQDAAQAHDNGRPSHQYSMRHANPAHPQNGYAVSYSPYMQRPLRGHDGAAAPSGYSRGSPAKKDQKHVVFQLIDPEDPRFQARLPMRVMISTHDTTKSIIETVKNFYGLYECGVSFENKEGISIVAAYDNFEKDMTVFVRVVPQPAAPRKDPARDSASPKKPSLGAPFMPQPSLGHSPSKTAARSAGVRSLSPQSDTGPRSMSAAPGGKPRPQRTKSKDNSVMGDDAGYSSDDNGGGSVTSSRKSKTELVNAEISVDNIVEGGRRKGAFESSQLPLFVPPNVPVSASMSSISPQRRNGPAPMASPYAGANQQIFSYQQPLPSPMSYGSAFNAPQPSSTSNGFSYPYNPPTRQLRGRPGSVAYPGQRQSGGGILPTPDPTNASAISDEDVALQLMRLGGPLAFSHGRTSTSTLDDALSGKAELASSDEESSEDDEQDLPLGSRFGQGDVGPQRKKQRTMNELPSDGTSGEEYEDHKDGNFGSDGAYRKKSTSGLSKTGRMFAPGALKAKPRSLSMAKPPKTSKTFPSYHNHTHTHIHKTPMSPSSMPAPSRKGSIASTTLNFSHSVAGSGAEEDDLSSKPRCQRCRKSKKGCDRQRPCGRCKDAGIGIEGCVSEDEGNGRKGRYGRHMGVTVKKADEVIGGEEGEGVYGSEMGEMGGPSGAPANGLFLAPALPDKSKKRKR